MSEGIDQKFVNDVINKTGFTFENFKKNPQQFRSRTDDWFVAADEGKLNTNYSRQKHYAKLPSGNEYECMGLKDVEFIFRSEGYKQSHLYFKSEMRQGATTDYYCRVTWEVKPECIK